VRRKSSRTLANLCATCALEKKGQNIKILDLRGLTDIADYFVIVSGESIIHLHSIADHIEEKVRERFDEKPWHREGDKISRWVLIDYVDVVVHLFTPETREFYGLESYWGDAPVKEITDEKVRRRTSKKENKRTLQD